MAKRTLKQIQEEIQGKSIQEIIDYLQALPSTGMGIGNLLERYYKLKEKQDQEIERLKKMLCFERKAYEEGYEFVAGVDEVGRGPLAGPVVAAAVILPKDLLIEGVNDSKKLTELQRERLFDIIKEKAVAYGISTIGEKDIDDVNILNATKRAMAQALGLLETQPDCVLLDAVKLEKVAVKQVSIIKGDSLSQSIAAASILAKVTRDRLLKEYDSMYPEYGFAVHKGYGTPQHISAIKKYGICPIHRVSFVKNFVK